MSTNRDFNRIAAAWMAKGPNELADRVLEAVLDEVHLTKQRRRLAVPWRTPPMSMPLRLAASVAIIAVLGVGAIRLFGSAPNVGAAPSPTPAPSPSPSPIPTASAVPSATPTSVTFVSPLYGYSLVRPANWSVSNASVQWPDGGLVQAANPEWFDVFIAPDWEGLNLGFIGVAAQTIPLGTTPEAWLLAYAERQAASGYACAGPVEAWVDDVVGTLEIRRIDTTCDGSLPSGELATGLHATDVVFVIDGTGYVMTGNPQGIDLLLNSFQPG